MMQPDADREGFDTRFDNCKTTEDAEAVLNSLGSKTKIGVQNGTTGEFHVRGDENWDSPGTTLNALASRDHWQSGTINGNIDLVIIDEAPRNA